MNTIIHLAVIYAVVYSMHPPMFWLTNDVFEINELKFPVWWSWSMVGYFWCLLLSFTFLCFVYHWRVWRNLFAFEIFKPDDKVV